MPHHASELFVRTGETAERFEGVTPDVLDNAQVLVHFRSGAVATLMLCMYCTGYREGLEIGVIGTEGWMIANSHGSRGVFQEPPKFENGL